MRVGAAIVPDETTLMDAVEIAERQGLELITDGRELKYSPRGHIPLGHRRFVIVDKDARRVPAPTEPRA